MGDATRVRRRHSAPFLHRGCEERRPARTGTRWGRRRHPRRRPQADRHCGIQPVRMHPDECHRCSERHQRFYRCRSREGHCAFNRQGIQSDQPLRGKQARIRQAVRRGQPLRSPRQDPILRRSIRKRGGESRIRHTVLQGSRPDRVVAGDRQANDPVLDHSGSGSRLCRSKLRPDERRRTVCAKDSEYAHHRPGARYRPGRNAHRGRDPAGRETARGDDLRRRRTPDYRVGRLLRDPPGAR